MKISHYFGIIVLAFLFSCGLSESHYDNKTNGNDSIKNKDSLPNHISLSKQDSLILEEQNLKQIWKTKISKAKFIPIFNKRLFVVGKFADTLNLDTLRESYISQLTLKETCNSYEISNLSLDPNSSAIYEENNFIMDTLISMICSAKPRLMLKSRNKNLKTLYLNKKDYCQITGILYLINVGDINSDKRDEIAVLCHSIRTAGVIETCRIFSYQNENWTNVLSFEVYGPQFFDNDPKSKIKNQIPGFLENKKGIWCYHDYHWQGLDSEMRPLKAE